MKVYSKHSGIGRSKYVVMYHNGEKRHEDGSAFYDLRVFKSQEKCGEFCRELNRKGYTEE